jgi:hypothetical protein
MSIEAGAQRGDPRQPSPCQEVGTTDPSSGIAFPSTDDVIGEGDRNAALLSLASFRWSLLARVD